MLAVVLALWAVLTPDTYVVPPSDERSTTGSTDGPDPAQDRARTTPVPGQVDAAGGAAAVERLERAVDRREPRLVDDLGADREAQRLLDAVVRNARELDVDDFSLRYVEETAPADASGAWQAAVEATWRFAGYDDDVAESEIAVGLVAPADGGGVRLDALALGDGSGGVRSPVWLTGPVDVASSPTTLVVSAVGPDEVAERDDTRARRAVEVVRRVLGDWQPRLVVEVPADEGGLDAALGARPGTYAAVAAVTAAVDGAASGSPVHVFLNPDVYGELGTQGAQVVMSHEAVHVATLAPSSSGVPLWLLEGFADYVALRDVDLPLSETAGQVADQVRADGAPRSLPGQAEFDTGAEYLGATYEAAWVACLVLVDRGGADALVQLYDAVSSGTPVDRALRQGFGWDVDDLTRAWRVRLEQIAG